MTQHGVVAEESHRDHSHLSTFWRHFLEMFGVMLVGMIGAAAIYLLIVGLTWDEAVAQHPMGSLLVVALGMSVPMAAWMVHRGMGRRNALEMAAAMALPVIPFLCVLWFGVTDTALCGPYCLLAIAAMVGLMLYRRREYSMPMAP